MIHLIKRKLSKFVMFIVSAFLSLLSLTASLPTLPSQPTTPAAHTIHESSILRIFDIIIAQLSPFSQSHPEIRELESEATDLRLFKEWRERSKVERNEVERLKELGDKDARKQEDEVDEWIIVKYTKL
jgi:cell shape-determining protein MreC